MKVIVIAGHIIKRLNMNKAIQILTNEIEEFAVTMNHNNDHDVGYIEGLKKALNIFNTYFRENLILKNNYFVIMFRHGDIKMPYVQELWLYSIRYGKRITYTFSKYSNSNSRTLVLSNPKAISKRVFATKDEAQNHIEEFMR